MFKRLFIDIDIAKAFLVVPNKQKYMIFYIVKITTIFR